jgi:hypothetical protein
MALASAIKPKTPTAPAEARPPAKRLGSSLAILGPSIKVDLL